MTDNDLFDGFWDKLRFKAATLISVSAVWAYAVYWSYTIHAGDKIGAASRFLPIRAIVSVVHGAVDSFGHAATGYAMMGGSITLWVFCLVFLWRTTLY